MPLSPLIQRLSLLVPVLISSCRPPDRVEVEQSRTAFRGEVEPGLGMADQQRFAENTAQQLLRWATPAGWRHVAATEFRNINFKFGPKQEGECYLSLISGSAGSVLDNFNRWRKQMAQPDMSAEDMTLLPTKMVLQRPAPTLDLTGTYTSASGPMMQTALPPKNDWRLVGSIFEAPGALFTIKMSGPKDLVAENLAAYDAFLTSLAPAMQPDGR